MPITSEQMSLYTLRNGQLTHQETTVTFEFLKNELKNPHESQVPNSQPTKER
jgi:hypothetical protein